MMEKHIHFFDEFFIIFDVIIKVEIELRKAKP